MSKLDSIRQRNTAEHNALQASHEELLRALKLAGEGIDEVWANCHSRHMKFIADTIQNAEALKG